MKRNKNSKLRRTLVILPAIVFISALIFSFFVLKYMNSSYDEKMYSKMVSFSERLSTQIYDATMYPLAQISTIKEYFLLAQNNKDAQKTYEALTQRALSLPNVHDLIIMDKTVVSEIYSKKDLSSLKGYDYSKDCPVKLTSDFFYEEAPMLLGPYSFPNGDKVLSAVIPVYKTIDNSKELTNILSYSVYFPEPYRNIDFKSIETEGFSYKIWTVNPTDGTIFTIFESEKTLSPKTKSNTSTFSKKAFGTTWFYTFEPAKTFQETLFFYVSLIISMIVSLLVTYATGIIIKDTRKENTQKTLKYQLKLADMQENTIYSLSNLVENRDGSTGDHVKRTSEYVMLLATLAKKEGFYESVLTEEYIKRLGQAAALHDIGKIIIPDHILKKPGSLTPEEFEQIKTHTTEGGRIIRDVFGQIQTKDFTMTAIEIASSHHERWDGKGYPSGLSGVTIPLSARFMSIADVFDALTTPRCYKKPFPFDRSIEIIQEGKGTQFDPVITEIFLKNKNAFKEILNSYYFQFD